MECSLQRHRVYHRLWTNTAGPLEAVLFSAKLKLVALRILLLAVPVNLLIQIQYVPVDEGHNVYFRIAGPLTLILVHHIVSAFKVRCIPRWLDLILMITELTLLASSQTTPLYHGWLKKWDSALDGWSMISWVSMWVILVFHFVCRIGAILRHLGKNLAKPFDLLEDRPQARLNYFPVNILSVGFSLLVSRSLWRNQFLGEGVFVRLIRGVLAVCLVTILLAYGVVSIAIQPALESIFIPTKQTRTAIYNYPIRTGFSPRQLPDPWDRVFGEATWGFYVATGGSGRRNINSTDLLRRAVNITITFQGSDSELHDLPCGNGSALFEEASVYGQEIGFNFDSMVKIRCPHDFNSNGDVHVESHGYNMNGNWVSTSDCWPKTLFNKGTGPIAIYPVLSNGIDPRVLFNDVVAFPLPPGVNYLATVSVRGKKVIDRQNQAMYALGLFNSPQVYLVPSLQYIVLDPLSSRSSSTSPNISTLRLSSAFDTTEFRVDTDVRENTIFAGFSTTGGIFTFLSGIFALLFGTTFLRIFLELSMFGIAQRWDRKRIVKAYLDAYQLLREELDLHASQRGVVSVMQDHLLDMNLFRDVLDAEQRIEVVKYSKDEEQGAGLDDNLCGDKIDLPEEDTVFLSDCSLRNFK